jgi:hypothetical protein
MKIKKLSVVFLLGGLLLLSCSDPSVNHPPEITWLSVPDSLQLPASADSLAAALLRAEVVDPDGAGDISSVYFYSQKPDGSLAGGGSPIPLNDNGELGDEAAHDGIYSTGIKLSSNNQTGTYVFTFYAKDKSGTLSEAMADSIEVYE